MIPVREMSDAELLDVVRAAVSASVPERREGFGRMRAETPFTSLGLDSMAAMEMTAQLEETIGAVLPHARLADIVLVGDLVSLIRDVATPR